MKKFLSVFLTAALAVSMLAGCGSKNETVTAKVIDIDLTNEEYAFGVDKNQPELLEKTNEFIAKIKSDGTLDEICKKYFSDGEPEAVKSATLDTSKDQLVVATNAAFEPFEYTKGEDYYGIDMEIAKLLADELGKELVIENMDFDAVCLSVSQQKCDIAMAGLTINEEREEYVTFTDSYYSASQRLIVPSKCMTIFCNDKQVATPEDTYETQIYKYMLEFAYEGNPDVIVGTHQVLIGVKGDTNLSGDVTVADAVEILMYRADMMANPNNPTYVFNEDPDLHKLGYFLGNVDCIKEGDDLNVADAVNILMFRAEVLANGSATWEQIVGYDLIDPSDESTFRTIEKL